MQMLYNSDHFVVVQFDFAAAEDGPSTAGERRGGYEIVDKLARKEAFIVGAVAEKFRLGVQQLADTNPTEEQFDDFIAGFTALAQHPVTLH